MSCRVFGCRFSKTHVTAAHRCGKCSSRGHGVMECGKLEKIEQLKRYLHEDIVLPESQHCRSETCNDHQTHQSEAHHCGYCDMLHEEQQCPQRDTFWLIKCPICRKHNTIGKSDHITVSPDQLCVICQENRPTVTFKSCGHSICCQVCIAEMDAIQNDISLDDYYCIEPETGPMSLVTSQDPDHRRVPRALINVAQRLFNGHTNPVYGQIYAGMGCTWFVRKITPSSPVEVFFLHSDAMGQYVENHLPQIQKFIDGCVLVSPLPGV